MEYGRLCSYQRNIGRDGNDARAFDNGICLCHLWSFTLWSVTWWMSCSRTGNGFMHSFHVTIAGSRQSLLTSHVGLFECRLLLASDCPLMNRCLQTCCSLHTEWASSTLPCHAIRNAHLSTGVEINIWDGNGIGTESDRMRMKLTNAFASFMSQSKSLLQPDDLSSSKIAAWWMDESDEDQRKPHKWALLMVVNLARHDFVNRILFSLVCRFCQKDLQDTLAWRLQGR